MIATKKRAKIGGEYGANGAHYKGGQFINENPANPKQHCITQPQKARKVEVAPYQWVLSDRVGPTIWSQVQNIAKFSETSFRSGNWICDRSTINNAALDFNGQSVEEYLSLVERFEAGERWL